MVSHCIVVFFKIPFNGDIFLTPTRYHCPRKISLMSTPFYYCIHGTFILKNYGPDRESVHFIAKKHNAYDKIKNKGRIRPSKDSSVQLRFEGVDTPELHYGALAQSGADSARDYTEKNLGFTGIKYVSSSTKVSSYKPLVSEGPFLLVSACQRLSFQGMPTKFHHPLIKRIN